MKRLAVGAASAIITLVVVGAHVAAAQPKHILVLRTEGGVDDPTRVKIDAQVLKLAKNIRGNVEPADITLTDAAAVSGCMWSEPSCKEQVLSTMGVDELVATTAAPLADGDMKISVRRIPRGAAGKEASSTIVSGQAIETRIGADIGPLFGVKAPPPDKAVPPPDKAVPPPDKLTTSPDTTGTSATKTGPDKTGTPDRAVPPPDKLSTSMNTTTTSPDTSMTSTGPTGPDTTTAPPDKAVPAPDTSTEPIGTHPEVTAAPNGRIVGTTEGGSGSRRWEVTGMAVGGGMVIAGVALWAAAGGVQSDINNAPTRTLKDIQHLQDLESKGDTYTTVGNVMFAGGLAVAGVSGYFFWRHRHHGSSHQAMLAPTLFDHGAGVAFTLGEAP